MSNAPGPIGKLAEVLLPVGSLGDVKSHSQEQRMAAAPRRTNPACASPCLTECEIDEVANLWGVNLEYVYHAQGWRCRAAAEGLLPADFVDEHGSVWLTSMLMSIFQMLGGWGKIGPKNDVESLEVIFAITIGTALFAYVQGSVLQYITQGSPAAMEYRAGLDALNYMFKEVRGVTPEMRRKARAFYRKASHGLHKRERYGEVRCRKAPMPQGPDAARPLARHHPARLLPSLSTPRARADLPSPRSPARTLTLLHLLCGCACFSWLTST